MQRHGIFIRRPFLHGLRTGTINVNLIINGSHPAEGDVVMLAAVILGQLDDFITFHL